MLGQEIFEMKGKSLEELESHWASFKSDLITLSTFHNDYSVDEALGVIKFVTPFIINCEIFRELEEKYKISCIGQLHEIKDFLEEKSDTQLLGMIKLGRTEWLEKRLEGARDAN